MWVCNRSCRPVAGHTRLDKGRDRPTETDEKLKVGKVYCTVCGKKWKWKWKVHVNGIAEQYRWPEIAWKKLKNKGKTMETPEKLILMALGCVICFDRKK
jgi:hypothetical protein